MLTMQLKYHTGTVLRKSAPTFIVFYSKNITLQSQYPTHDTRVITFRNLEEFEGPVV